MNMKSVDLTNPTQKGIAAVLAIAFIGVVAYFALPPIAFILGNVWRIIGYGVPLLFLIWNWQILWSLFKQVSWSMTKKIISSNPLWYLYQWYDYNVKIIKEVEENANSISTIRVERSRKLQQLLLETEKLKREAVQFEKEGKSPLLKVALSKVAFNTKQADSLLPKLQFLEKQESELKSLYELMTADAEILKFELDGKAEEYEAMKSLSKVSDSANKILSTSSPEYVEYQQSIKQIEKDISHFTANAENMARKTSPKISRMSSEQSANEQEGLSILEEYKKNRQLPGPAAVQPAG